MSNQKKQISFHMMHSMKGGCGKSTCALFKTLQLAKERNISTERAEVLFLDADFKGSAMQPLLFRNAQDVQDKEMTSRAETVAEVRKKMSTLAVGNGLRHTIAIPNGYRPEDNLSRYLKEGDVAYNTLVQKTFSYHTNPNPNREAEMPDSEMLMNGYIDFILAAADSESKDWFRKYHGKIGPGIFIYRMEDLFKKILYHNAIAPRDNDKSGRSLGQYTDVIIDMPPGYDEYSDMLLDILRNLATEDKRIKLYYYAITTGDIGHRRLAKDNIEKLCGPETKFRAFAKVNAILSNPYSAKLVPGTQEKNNYDPRIKNQIQELKDSLKRKGKVYLNEYNASYHDYCTIPEIFEFELEGKTLEECKDEDKPDNNAGIL